MTLEDAREFARVMIEYQNKYGRTPYEETGEEKNNGEDTVDNGGVRQWENNQHKDA